MASPGKEKEVTAEEEDVKEEEDENGLLEELILLDMEKLSRVVRFVPKSETGVKSLRKVALTTLLPRWSRSEHVLGGWSRCLLPRS